MFEQTFKNIDDILHKDAGCTSELDYTEQSSWLLFLKYLDSLELDNAAEAELEGKARKIQHMTATTFWSADGRPMSAAQYLEALYGTLPEFFKDEDELRSIWSAPDTRKKLLAGLADKGFGREPLAEMQAINEAENSDLFDVLAYVAFAAEPVTRVERAAAAHAAPAAEFTDKQQAFVDSVLAQYVRQGVDELDAEKLSPLLQLKYRGLNDAFAELGKPEQVRRVFVGFQRHLYEPAGQRGNPGVSL